MARLIVSSGITLVMIFFTLGMFSVEANQAQTNMQGDSAQSPSIVSPDWGEWSAVALSGRRRQEITATFTITPASSPIDASFPIKYLRTGVPLVSKSTSAASLPTWVEEMLYTGNSRNAESNLVFTQMVATQSPEGALNGQRITYTIIITNNGSSSVTHSVVNILPDDALADLKCTIGECTIMSNTVSVTIPVISADGKNVTSSTKEIEIPTRVDWQVGILASQPVTRQFSGLITCQRDGAVLTNNVFVQDSGSNLVNTSVEVPSVGSGKLSLSAQATWCSDDLGGVRDLDWGDFDLDGDLDLALGSDSGVTVYRNNNGDLTLFWEDINQPRIFSVRWADVITDSITPELIGVGDYVNTTPGFAGKNYIYEYRNDNFVPQNLSTDDVLWRIAPADYDNDGDIDLAAASYIDLVQPNLYNLCLVRIYDNTGDGSFEANECLIGGLRESPFWSSSETDRTSSLAWADYDNDGDLDLGVGNDSNQPNRVYRNIGGNLALEWSSEGLNDTRSVAWGDFNADGTLDFAAGNYLESNLIYSNTNTGDVQNPAFELDTTAAWTSTENSQTTSLDWNTEGPDASIPVGDDSEKEYVLPFDFPYFGRTIKKINVNTNGGIELLEVGELPCSQCRRYFNTHSSGYHKTQNADFIFGLSDDLYTGVIIEAFPSANPTQVHITWMGTTYSDRSKFATANGELLFKVIMHENGNVHWKFFDINYQTQYQQTPLGDFFSGLYDAEADLDYTTGFTASLPQLPPVPSSVTQAVFVFTGTSIIPDTWNNRDQSIPPRDNENGFEYSFQPDFIFDGTTFTRMGVSPNGIIELLENVDVCSICNSNNPIMYPWYPPPGGELIIDYDYGNNNYVFAANDDLKTAVFIEGYTDTVHITWMGTTARDDDFLGQELAFKLNLITGTQEVRWKFFDMNYTFFSHGLFSGIANGVYPANFDGIFGGVQGLGTHKWFLYDGSFRILPQGAALAVGNQNQVNQWYRTDDSTGILEQTADSGAWSPTNAYNTQSVSWGDFDNDGDFDLAVGNNGDPNQVYLGTANQLLTPDPIWFSNQADATVSVAWADYDLDGDLDLAVGNDNQPNHIYRNSGGALTTDPVWSSVIADATRSVAWADYDGDGDPDLAVGNYNQPNYIYRNLGDGAFELIWSSNDLDATRSIAWGDYDADGDLDLAVGNDGQPNRLYRNRLFFRTPSSPQPERLGRVNDLAWGDYDNDGDLDLAIGGIDLETPGGGFIHLIDNLGNNLDLNSQPIDNAGLQSELYNLVWGDYDRDGYLDLAGSFPQVGVVQIYHNENGAGFATPITVTTDITETFAIDWADLNQNGQLDLIVGDSPPKIFEYNVNTASFSLDNNIIITKTAVADEPQIVAVRAIDHDNDGDLDVTFGNFFGASLLFSTFAPHLNPTLTEKTDKFSFSSVAWGDADGDGDLDLLFGAGPSPFITGTVLVIGSKLYLNEQGQFLSYNKDILASGAGPHRAAFGDGNNNGRLDIAIVRQSASADDQIYYDGSLSPGWTSSLVTSSQQMAYDLAWGDADADGDLDLLVGNDGLNMLYLKEETGATYSAMPISNEDDSTRSVAWGDYDKDFDLDFVVGNANQPTRLYRNDGRNNFALVWSSDHITDTRSVAWGDMDGDGELELAVGNYGGANNIYENLGQDSNYLLSKTPVWSSTTLSKTTSLAWGDWDNDGDLDLAVGNDGEADQVYSNNSDTNVPRLRWLWTSEETYKTSDVAWGDMDGDGDLDLAISQDGEDVNGVYENNYILPSHLTNNFAQTIPLPNIPSYLSIDRPGQTATAYFYSSSEILSGPLSPTVYIHYTLFDPDGTRDENVIDESGDKIVKTLYEYSVDVGGNWQTATPVSGWSGESGETSRLGQKRTFPWDAPADAAISDQALFRITVIPQSQIGQAQRASTSATSPPFRLKGLTCEWPEEPSFTYSFGGNAPAVNQPIQFEGAVAAGSGVMTFTWDFGDNTTKQNGQVLQHTYTLSNSYLVTMTVVGEACPISNKVLTHTIISIGVPPGVFLDKKIHLPLVMNSSALSVTTRTITTRIRASQVTGLQGISDLGSGTAQLIWSVNAPTEAIGEYRIYRRSRIETDRFQLLASVPGEVTTYTDPTATCGHMYYITAVNVRGESPPSTASYFSPPCR